MDTLSKTIKKLPEHEYQQLLAEVSGNRKNKPFIVLETTRKRDIDDSEMMEMLQVNPSAYYTLKSRLNSKIAAVLSKKVENPIQGLMDEVSRVPAHLFGGNRDFSVRALRELEKQLVEYDMNAELIVVYKTLAQLNLHTEDYDFYNSKYQRHVAYSLAVSKAEGIFFRFIKRLGTYQLSAESTHLDEIIAMKRELSNICELYDSHRLYVLYNIVRIYYHCNVSVDREGLKSREEEIEFTLDKLSDIFNRYPMDTFYQNMKWVVDLLRFEYYVRTSNLVKADHYIQKIHLGLPSMTCKHIMNFFVVQFLRAKLAKYRIDGNLNHLLYYADKLDKGFDVETEEAYHYVSVMRYLATVRFYQGDYSGAARKLNELRNCMSLKQYLHTDVDVKVFQALQYCIVGEDGLCQQILSSLKRQIREQDDAFASARHAIKIIKTALKPADYRKKVKRIAELWDEFTTVPGNVFGVLADLRIEEAVIRKMSNPIKS